MARFIRHGSSVSLSFIVCAWCEFSRRCMYCTNSISENPGRCCGRCSDRNIPPLLSSIKSLRRHFNNVGGCHTDWIHTVCGIGSVHNRCIMYFEYKTRSNFFCCTSEKERCSNIRHSPTNTRITPMVVVRIFIPYPVVGLISGDEHH